MKEKMKENMKKNIIDYLSIALGSLFVALSLNIFLVPNKISSGGISTIGTILYYTLNIPLSASNIFFNILLFVFGYKYLGHSSISKTLAGIIFLSIFLSLTENFSFHTDDLFITSVTGGVILGMGLGIILRKEASTGGSDFAGLILKKFFPHLSISLIIMILDFVIIIFMGIVFKSIIITIYSIISMYSAMKIADYFITLGNSAKSVYIISSKYEEISNLIIKEFRRGVTGVLSQGMYSDNEYIMLLSVVSPKELPKLTNTIRNIDRNSFIIISDVHEVLGQGFKS